MNDLSGNKIMAALLTVALVIVGLNAVIPELFQKTPPAKPGYLIAVAEDTAGGGEAPDVPPDWGTVLKTADVAAGEAKTAACQSCHKFDPAGTNSTGPGLYGVVGRKPGTHPGFAYSQGMTDFGAKQPVWDYDHLYMFLKRSAGLHLGHQDDLHRSQAASGPDQRHRLPTHSRVEPANSGAQSQGRRRRARARKRAAHPGGRRRSPYRRGSGRQAWRGRRPRHRHPSRSLGAGQGHLARASRCSLSRRLRIAIPLAR